MNKHLELNSGNPKYDRGIEYTTNAVRNDVWFQFSRPDSNASMRLFCFPHAGSGASAYREWPHFVPSQFEICSVQLPGRESRFTEPAIEHMDPLLDQLFPPVLSQLSKPFVFFGHSMGAIIAFELVRRLQMRQLPMPLALIVSGRGAPQTADTGPVLHTLPDDEFIDELRQYDGIAEEVLDDPELMQLLMPILRSDSKVCDTYTYTDGIPLRCPIYVYGGEADERVDRTRLEGWQQQTSRQFRLKVFEGGHFFIQSDVAMRSIATDLAAILEAQPS